MTVPPMARQASKAYKSWAKPLWNVAKAVAFGSGEAGRAREEARALRLVNLSLNMISPIGIHGTGSRKGGLSRTIDCLSILMVHASCGARADQGLSRFDRGRTITVPLGVLTPAVAWSKCKRGRTITVPLGVLTLPVAWSNCKCGRRHIVP